MLNSMAEKKYELLLGPRRDSQSKIKHQPWYLERLNTKYDRKPPLVASTWTFIKDGLDDFRDGKPASIDSSIIIKGNKGITPCFFNTYSSNGQKQRGRKELDKQDIVYSKCSPNQRKQKDRVNTVEQNLLNHPLALYPHIEDVVPPDLFEDIIDLLDPALTLNDDIELNEDNLSTPRHHSSPTIQQVGVNQKEDTESIIDEVCSGYNKALRSQRRQVNKINAEDETNVKDDKQRLGKKASQQPTKIETVTSEFCDWVQDLGGDTNNIEESTINNLFASGYDTKPTLSVPVHVVELTNVPPELRADAHLSNHDHDNFHEEKRSTAYTPSWVKVKYGAWYLKPKSWKVRNADEPLQDPKEVEGKLMSASKKKSKELDKVLTSLHGAKSFRTFIENKGVRNPEFLEGVSVSADEDSTTIE